MHAHADADEGRSGLMILIGNAVHNFCDGVVIAAAFLANPGLGVATTLAIVAHAVPQQVGDFAVLIHSGFTRAARVRVQRHGRIRHGRRRAGRLLRAGRHAADAADRAGHRCREPALRRGGRSHPEPASPRRSRSKPPSRCWRSAWESASSRRARGAAALTRIERPQSLSDCARDTIAVANGAASAPPNPATCRRPWPRSTRTIRNRGRT